MREFELLQHVYASNQDLPDTVVIPPGDDMGAITIGDRTLLVTVDQLADQVHVDVGATSLDRVGRKAMTRNLSDVAAMAARPLGAVAAVSLPRGMGENQTRRMFDAMRQTAASFGCPLVGGDVSVWNAPLVLTVTVLAEPGGIQPVLRKGAKVGDAVYVSGSLGGSLSSGHHLDFTPRLALARALAGNPATRPHCMIDLSDGLARDLPHLCEAAGPGVGAVIDASALPLRQSTLTWEHAVGDGEDYELLFTAPQDAMPSEVGGVAITAVGRIVGADHDRKQADGQKEAAVSIRLPDGTVRPLGPGGWEHHG